MYKIFIVEDHWLIQQEYTALIEREPDLEICGYAATAREALEKIPQCTPDLVIVDISLADVDGIELVTQLQTQQPDLPALIISGHYESPYVKKALRAGARGYITKSQAWVIAEAARQVLQGKLYLGEQIRDEHPD
jgi:DNA-binding NarL/FixJ family response regulator